MPAWDDAEHWRQLCDGSACPICARGQPLDIVAELQGCFVTASPVACLKGQCCLVHKRHAVELHDLDEAEAVVFVLELRRLARAAGRVAGAVKVNLELHGNTLPHLHAHVFPRRPGDRFAGRPIDPAETEPPVYEAGEFERLIADLRQELGLAEPVSAADRPRE
jgi:diadenosine tetraphosphate (Ap4A) HIT family hydrolase